MKLKSKILLTAGALGAAAFIVKAMLENKPVADMLLPAGFTVTAHTGCEGTKDNSLDAITLGYGNGADIVEFDLNFNADGVPVLSHDKPKGNEVTLDEAFALVAGYNGLQVNVDVKNPLDLTMVKTLAEKHGIADRFFFTGIGEEWAPVVREQTPDIIYYLNTSVDKSRIDDKEYISELISKVKETGAAGLNIHFGSCSRLMVDMLHAEGLKVSVWTVNKKSAMRKVLTYGCDNITTRKISDLMSFVRTV